MRAEQIVLAAYAVVFVAAVFMLGRSTGRLACHRDCTQPAMDGWRECIDLLEKQNAEWAALAGELEAAYRALLATTMEATK